MRQKVAPSERRLIAACPKEKMFEKVGVCDSPAHAVQVAPAIEKVGQELPVRKLSLRRIAATRRGSRSSAESLQSAQSIVQH